MKVNANDMTAAEWELMRIIWTKGQATSSEIIAAIQTTKDWSDSTVKTLLRRLVSKQYLATSTAGRGFIYTPLIAEGAAMQEITTDLFTNICAMQQGSVLINLLDHVALSQANIATMQAILAQKALTAPAQVACDCLPTNTCETNCDHCAI